MTVPIPAFRIGDAVRYESLEVYPIFGGPVGSVDYELSDEAMGRGGVVVEEISQTGSVPVLSVENKGDRRVLFLEGDQLVGAKQNRILNASVLIPARTKCRIPVSCVESGRWRYSSSHFSHGDAYSPGALRGVLKGSVSRSLRAHQGHASDQGAVWAEIARKEAALGYSSGTHAMSDGYEAYRKQLDEYRERMTYADGAVGLAMGIGGRLVSIDFFDKPSTCRKVWARLVSGMVLDALEVRPADKRVDFALVQGAVADLGRLPCNASAPVGEGEEYRAASSRGGEASALVLEGTVVHGSTVYRD